MIRRWSLLFLLLLILFLPVQARVPVSASYNDNINAAFPVENPGNPLSSMAISVMPGMWPITGSA